MTYTDLVPDATQGFRVPGECELCGRLPAEGVRYSGVTGFLLARRHWSFQANLCRSCSRGLFRSAQSRLLLTGWWSPMSLVATPFLFVGNVLKFYNHRRNVNTPAFSDPDVERALEGRPLYQRLGVIVFVVALLAVAANALASSDDEAATEPTTASAPTTTTDPGGGQPEAALASATTASPSSVLRSNLDPGDCFDMAGTSLVAMDVAPVPCGEAHAYELYARHQLVGSGYPGEAWVDERAYEYCYEQFAPYVGTPYETSGYAVTILTPTTSSWILGDRTIECLISAAGPPGSKGLVGQARSSRR